MYTTVIGTDQHCSLLYPTERGTDKHRTPLYTQTKILTAHVVMNLNKFKPNFSLATGKK